MSRECRAPEKKTYIVFPIQCAPIFILYTATTVPIHHIILSFLLQTQLSNSIREAAYVTLLVWYWKTASVHFEDSLNLLVSSNFSSCMWFTGYVTLGWSYLLTIYGFFTKSMSLLKSLASLRVMVRYVVIWRIGFLIDCELLLVAWCCMYWW